MNNHTKNELRYDAIDTLRGIAALLVVWQHVAESLVQIPTIAQNGTILADLSKNLDFGRIGIICFFLISGFVIPSSLSYKTPCAIKGFAIKRIFRLYPAYWFSLICIVILYKYIGFNIENSTILANTTMLQSFFGKNHLIGLYWTLQVELVFYVLCAILFYLGKLNNEKFIFLLMLVLFFFFVVEQIAINYTTQLNWSKEFQFLPYLICVMFLGSFYRKLYDNPKNIIVKKYALITTFLCLGLPVFLLISSLIGFNLASNAYRFGVAHSLAFVLFFLGLNFFTKAPRYLIWLGTISYSLYLFHPIVLYFVKYLIKTNESLLLFKSYHLSLYLIFITFCSILLASLIYYSIEKPAIKFGKKYI